MTNPPDPHSPDADRAPAAEVEVARTGGIAGMTRRWSARLSDDEAQEWVPLLDRCPWERARPRAADDSAGDAPGPSAREGGPMPDGFVWWIRASWSGRDPREAELPDPELVGAWRELVDAVRDWSRRGRHPEHAGN
ncbi:protealysin inhibitor emfourin [Microbacterium timonense]|uniref:protealysin inhibitor emfourin n=1 Tax=Microbacterium timonense TaxID=2086576 RepID=UPI000D112304|nr:protealysin inhibitor emfourin [Microbacterium timonense]